MTNVCFAYRKSSTERFSRNDVEHEADRLFEHRLAQLVVERREALAIDGVVLFEAPEVEPVAAELGRQAAHARVLQHPPRLAHEHLGPLQLAFAATASSSSSGMLDQRK